MSYFCVYSSFRTKNSQPTSNSKECYKRESGGLPLQSITTNHKTNIASTTLRWVMPVLLLLAGLSANHASAQLDQGAIIGVVTDSTGAVIPTAQVTLTETSTGLVLKTKTNASGNYFFSPIKTGTYTVSASAPNFETTEERISSCTCTDRLNIPLASQAGQSNARRSLSPPLRRSCRRRPPKPPWTSIRNS